MPVAGDVPGKFDVVINAEGYMTADTEAVKAQMGSLPLYPRRGFEGSGSEEQEFAQTYTISDWSGGEGERMLGSGEARNKIFQANNVDLTRPDQVTLMQDRITATVSAAYAACSRGSSASEAISFAGLTNLFNLLPNNATPTDNGAHGAGTPSRYGMVSDGVNAYIAGSTALRKWNGSAFSTLTSQSITSLAMHKNQLYGLRTSNADLFRLDQATSEFTFMYSWREGDGTASTYSMGPMLSHSDGLFMLLNTAQAGSELWVMAKEFECQQVAVLPGNFYGHGITATGGTIFVSGSFNRYTSSSTLQTRPAVFVLRGGQMEMVWEADDWTATFAAVALASAGHTPIATWEQGVIWHDNTRGRIMFYDPRINAYSSIATGSTSATFTINHLVSSLKHFAFLSQGSTTGYTYPSSTMVSSGAVYTSLIDFSSPLSKRFRSIEIEAVIPSGGSIDLAYEMDGLTGSTSAIQTGAVSGTQYAINQTGRAISIRVTLNKGTTLSPILKKITLRATPYQSLYRNEVYVLNCTGRDGSSPILLRDGTLHSKDGLEMAIDLRTAAAVNSYVTVTDEFGTFTGVIDTTRFELRRIRTHEYLAVVPIVEVSF